MLLAFPVMSVPTGLVEVVIILLHVGEEDNMDTSTSGRDEGRGRACVREMSREALGILLAPVTLMHPVAAAADRVSFGSVSVRALTVLTAFLFRIFDSRSSSFSSASSLTEQRMSLCWEIKIRLNRWGDMG